MQQRADRSIQPAILGRRLTDEVRHNGPDHDGGSPGGGPFFRHGTGISESCPPDGLVCVCQWFAPVTERGEGGQLGAGPQINRARKKRSVLDRGRADVVACLGEITRSTGCRAGK